MMQQVRRLILFLLLGAIVNIAVAWGCAFLVVDGSTSVGRYAQPQAQSPYWYVTSFTRPGAVRMYGLRPLWVDAAVSGSVLVQVPHWSRFNASPTSLSDRWVDDGRGWPLLSMHVSFNTAADPNDDAAVIADCIGGIALPGRASVRSIGVWDLRALPLLPIWPGFAINTIIYSGILWMILVLPFALRRQRRIRRGLCPSCAYPIGASELCTECGKPLDHSARLRVRR
jgi:hypothetical protein